MYEKLFSEGKIGKVTFRNRLVMSPMGIGLAELDGTPGDEMIAYYAASAGLNASAGCCRKRDLAAFASVPANGCYKAASRV